MCQTSAPQNLPLNTAGAQDVVGDDPLSAAIQSEQRANPTTVSVDAPTKFGKLLKLVQPMVEGAVVGGFSGKGHPGGGFGAAADFYAQQNQRRMQMAMLQHTLQNDQFRNALEAAKTTHEINRPNFPRVSVTAAKDSSGTPVLLRTNPQTGEPEPIEGFSPADKDNDSFTPVMTDKGLMLVDKKQGTIKPATLGDQPQTGAPSATPGAGVVGAGTPTGAPASSIPANSELWGGPSNAQLNASVTAPPAAPSKNKFDTAPGAARLPQGAPGGAHPSSAAIQSGGAVGSLASGAPLMPPSAAKDKNPKASVRTRRDAAGNETDVMIDENPQSPTFGKTLSTTDVTRAPNPTTANNNLTPQVIDATAQDLVDGNADLKQVASMRGNMRTKLFARASELAKEQGKTFSTQNYTRSLKTVEDFVGGGKDAAKLTAFNTSIQHADLLLKAGEALKNGQTQILNRIGNEFQVQTGGTPQATYNAIKTALSGELGSLYKTGQATDTELGKVSDTLSSDLSPEQLNSVIIGHMQLAAGKANALRNNFKNGTGKEPEQMGIDFLAPESLEVLKRRGIIMPSSKRAAAGAPGAKSDLPTYDLSGNRVK